MACRIDAFSLQVGLVWGLAHTLNINALLGMQAGLVCALRCVSCSLASYEAILKHTCGPCMMFKHAHRQCLLIFEAQLWNLSV